MVGGVVIGVTRVVGKPTHVHVAECPHYPKHKRGECPRPDTCCVYCEEVGVDQRVKDWQIWIQIEVGDSIWWQSGHCYWTPEENRGKPNNRCGVDFDIKLPKIGYSH